MKRERRKILGILSLGMKEFNKNTLRIIVIYLCKSCIWGWVEGMISQKVDNISINFHYEMPNYFHWLLMRELKRKDNRRHEDCLMVTDKNTAKKSEK